MKPSILLRGQANEILDVVRQKGFDPVEFRWTEPQIGAALLSHAPTGHSLMIKAITPEYFGVYYSPAEGAVRYGGEVTGWNSAFIHVRTWLNALREEIETPDLWAEIGERVSIASAAASTAAETPLTGAERQRIAKQIDEVREYAATILDRQSEGFRRISAQLTYIEQAGERLGRKDWINIAIGVLVSAAFDEGTRQAFGEHFQAFMSFAMQRIHAALDLGAAVIQRLTDS